MRLMKDARAGFPDRTQGCWDQPARAPDANESAGVVVGRNRPDCYRRPSDSTAGHCKYVQENFEMQSNYQENPEMTVRVRQSVD
jgi:hypothetical protein